MTEKVNNIILSDLTDLILECRKYIQSKNREQAFTVVYDSVRAVCESEIALARENNPELLHQIEKSLNNVLVKIGECKKMEDYSIQRAIGKIEVSAEIIEKIESLEGKKEDDS